MPKAMIISVGAQGEQIIFSLNKIKPDFVGFLATNTVKNVVGNILEKYRLKPTNFKIFYCEDKPSEIGKIVQNFFEIYKWLTEEEKIKDNKIFVDSTGGRKWMSAGVTMIASFLGLNMIYIDAGFKDGKPDPLSMKVVELGNAYQQTGFLEEDKADKLFNEYNFSVASSLYEYLAKKLPNPQKVEIKNLISKAYLYWSQFKFLESYPSLESAIEKIQQYEVLNKYFPKLKQQLKVLKILKINDENTNGSLYELLKNNNFTKYVLLTLLAQSERLSEQNNFDQAVIILYRILELISQYRLAKNSINTSKVSPDIKLQYNEQFKEIRKRLFGAEGEIPNKIALVESWILLFCLKDEQNIDFLRKLQNKTELRNSLWWEHKNKTVNEKNYLLFKEFVVNLLAKVLSDWEKEVKLFKFIKF